MRSSNAFEGAGWGESRRKVEVGWRTRRRETEIEQRQCEKGREGMRTSGNVGRTRSSWEWLAGPRGTLWQLTSVAQQSGCSLASRRYSQGLALQKLLHFRGAAENNKRSIKGSQVRRQRLCLAVVPVMWRLVRSDIHADLLGR